MDAKLGSAGMLVLGGLLLAAPTRRAELDHVGNYNFKIEIEGISAGYFRDFDGLGAEVEVISEVVDTRDGGLYVRKRPGRVKYGDITLKKGILTSPELIDWFQAVESGKADPRSMRLDLRARDGSGERSWEVFGAWPRSWKISGFDGKANDVLTEEMVIVIEWFEEA